MVKNDVEELKSIFITWSWFVGAIAGAIVLAASVSYLYAEKQSNQDYRITDLETRMNKVEMISKDLDTVKTLLRKR